MNKLCLTLITAFLLGLTTAQDFPVTIEHKYGSTTITEKPERIVTVGLTDQDALLALGITPVGTTEWIGNYPGAVWPWAQDKLGANIPEIVGDAGTINFETITALEPDVILALFAGVTQEQYELLSEIAPTVAQPGAYVDYGIPWQELTRTVGQVVGMSEEADALVNGVEGRFKQIRADHPEFEGATAVAATTSDADGLIVYGMQDSRSYLLTSLGFVLPEGLRDVIGEEFSGSLSEERVDLLDVDVILWLDVESLEEPLGGPVYPSLNVAKEKREVFLGPADELLDDAAFLNDAAYFVSVLSLPYLLDGLVPRLVTAVDGDPTTNTNQ
jgi:iron complex transport system substrate-binding protein